MSSIYLYENDLPDNFKIEGDLAVDTEAMGLHNIRDRLCVIQISSGDGKAHLVHFTSQDYSAPNLRKLLSDANCTFLFHYGRFDVALLYHTFGILMKNVYCTKIASKFARTYTDNHGLKDLCRELLGISISKQQQSSYWGEESLTDAQRHYAASDVLHLHELRAKLNHMLIREGRMEYVAKCCEFMPYRAMFDVHGWDNIDILSY